MLLKKKRLLEISSDDSYRENSGGENSNLEIFYIKKSFLTERI